MSPLEFNRDQVRSLLARTRTILARAMRPLTRIGLWITARLPKGLYARSLLIIVTPMVLLQSVVAFVFLPPTLIASIYGMNFKVMPELDWPWGYPMALGMMVVSALVPYLFFRWKKWL